MAINPVNPYLTLQFAQNLGQQQPLTQLGGQIGGLIQGIQQKRAMEAAQEQYLQDLNAYADDPTEDNFAAYLQSAGAIGKLDEAKAITEGLDERQRQTFATQNVNILGAIDSGNTDLAMNLAGERMKAYSAQGDEEKASTWQNISSALVNGDTDSARMFLETITGVTPEGQEALKNRREQQQNRRDATNFEAELIKTGLDFEWATEADRQRAMAEADKLNLPTGRALMELGSVVSTQGLDPSELTDQFQSLRKEYNDLTEGYNESLNSARQIQGLVESEADTGMVDAAILDYFNRVTNPDAVVRLSDVQRTTGAQGIVDRVENLKQKLLAGTSFTEATRQDMLDVVNTVRGLTEQAKQEASGAIDSSLQRMAGDDEEFLGQARSEVFGPNWNPGQEEGQDSPHPNRALQAVQESDLYTHLTDEEKEAVEGMTAEQLRAEFPDIVPEATTAEGANLTTAQQQRFREYLANANGVTLSSVQNVPIDTLIKDNPGSWRGFSQREGLNQQQPDMTLDWD